MIKRVVLSYSEGTIIVCHSVQTKAIVIKIQYKLVQLMSVNSMMTFAILMCNGR